MGVNRRQAELLHLLEKQEWLSVEEATGLLNASPATIRRDLQLLEESGALERVRGGARLARGAGMLTFQARENTASGPKSAIARAAVALLSPGDVVFVDGGTTTFHIADHLPTFRLTIVTNSLRLATALDAQSIRRPELSIFLTGGVVIPGSSLLAGPAAVAGLRQYHADWAFLSAGGIAPEGIYNGNEWVVESERMMIEQATRTAVLVDATKFERRALVLVAELSAIHTVITDADEAAVNFLKVAGIRVQTTALPREA